MNRKQLCWGWGVCVGTPLQLAVQHHTFPPAAFMMSFLSLVPLAVTVPKLWGRHLPGQGVTPKAILPRRRRESSVPWFGNTAPWGRVATPESAPGWGWVWPSLFCTKIQMQTLILLSFWGNGVLLLEQQTSVSKVWCASAWRQATEVDETCHLTTSLPPSPHSSGSVSSYLYTTVQHLFIISYLQGFIFPAFFFFFLFLSGSLFNNVLVSLRWREVGNHCTKSVTPGNLNSAFNTRQH